MLPSIQNNFAKIANDILTSTNGGVNPQTPNTTENALVTSVATFFAAAQESLNLSINEQFLISAQNDSSIIKETDALGLTRKPSTTASGSVAVQGEVGSIISPSNILNSSSNINYVPLSTVTISQQTFVITSLSCTSGIATAQTNLNHNFGTGMLVAISGANISYFNNPNVVVSVISDNQFSYKVNGADATTGGSIICLAIYASVPVISLTAGSQTNLNAGSTLTFQNVVVGVNNNAVVNFNGITGGQDVEDIESLRSRGIIAQKIFASNIAGDAFSVGKLASELLQNTVCTRAWVYQAKNSTEQGTVTTVAVNDNQTPITLNSAQLQAQLNYIISIQPSFLVSSNITCLTANLVSVNVTIVGLTNNNNSMRNAIKQELINFFQNTSEINRVLPPNVITLITITTAVQNTVDVVTNTQPVFSSISISGLTLVNDNDLPILGVLTINGTPV